MNPVLSHTHTGLEGKNELRNFRIFSALIAKLRSSQGEQSATTALPLGLIASASLNVPESVPNFSAYGDRFITFTYSNEDRLSSRSGKDWAEYAINYPAEFSRMTGKFTLPDGTFLGSKP